MGLCPDKRAGMPTENREKILELKNLAVSFATPQGEVQAVREVNLSVEPGEIICIVGESGCGKTVLCQSVMHLLPESSQIKSGEIRLCGRDITESSENELQKLRGTVMAMVFQDPLTTLNPTIPVGKQIMEMLLKKKMNRREAKKRALQLMELTGIEKAGEKFDLQPHFLSGGMRQRCVLAAALASDPALLLADEVTTALDVTVETKILDLLLEIRRKTGTAIIFVTHDLGAAARIADRVAVMYAGKIVEIGKAEEIFYAPRHPYTSRLLSSMPISIPKNQGISLEKDRMGRYLKERDDNNGGKRNNFRGMSAEAVF
jgi:ABC-type dipeptide/oligopeptide/nickel transport system ATPase component